MRVIGGSARGRKLTAFRGDNIRPTTDRVRESLFSILTSRLGSLDGLTVLDLFAGSGALGIEALSRGAASACFVDRARQSIATIRRNLELCHLTDRAEMLQMDSQAVLSGLLRERAFDLIFMDPPYGKHAVAALLEPIGRRQLLHENGLVVVESGSQEEVPAKTAELQRIDQRRYGSTLLSFFDRINHES